MKRIAVLTSGGDAPGMNAAIRAVTRGALDQGWEIFGVRRGFAGLIDGNFEPMNARNVGGIIQLRGPILGSARSAEFTTEEGRRKAARALDQRDIEGLVVIGGNGTQAGASALSLMGFPVVGVASTIDNDLAGSDITIGVDTALNIALEAIDRLKITASSHQRAFLVEVTGRNCGYRALMRQPRPHLHNAPGHLPGDFIGMTVRRMRGGSKAGMGMALLVADPLVNSASTPTEGRGDFGNRLTSVIHFYGLAAKLSFAFFRWLGHGPPPVRRGSCFLCTMRVAWLHPGVQNVLATAT